MANSRIMLVCKHCGGEMVLGKGYFGKYSCCDNKSDELNAFFEEHQCGCCTDVADCSDNARNHFVILEEGETLADVVPKSEVEVAREIFEEIDKAIGEQYPIYTVESIIKCLAELKKKYTE